jgi:hypothetical protein
MLQNCPTATNTSKYMENQVHYQKEGDSGGRCGGRQEYKLSPRHQKWVLSSQALGDLVSQAPASGMPPFSMPFILFLFQFLFLSLSLPPHQIPLPPRKTLAPLPPLNSSRGTRSRPCKSSLSLPLPPLAPSLTPPSPSPSQAPSSPSPGSSPPSHPSPSIPEVPLPPQGNRYP